MSGEPLDEDGLNPARALILHAYYGLRCKRPAPAIGGPEITAWILAHAPEEALPSPSLIQLTLDLAELPHRGPGRPRRVDALPLCPLESDTPPLPQR